MERCEWTMAADGEISDRWTLKGGNQSEKTKWKLADGNIRYFRFRLEIFSPSSLSTSISLAFDSPSSDEGNLKQQKAFECWKMFFPVALDIAELWSRGSEFPWFCAVHNGLWGCFYCFVLKSLKSSTNPSFLRLCWIGNRWRGHLPASRVVQPVHHRHILNSQLLRSFVY